MAAACVLPHRDRAPAGEPLPYWRPIAPCILSCGRARGRKRDCAATTSCAPGAGRDMSKRTFRVVLIKPSHYDGDGYVIQWWRSTIPSNSLASVHGLIAECAESRALGPDVDIDLDAIDECNTIIDVDRVARQVRA